MGEDLELPVTFRGKDFLFPFKIVPQGYVYKFVVQIDDLEVIYEKDDQNEFRAIISKPDEYKGKIPEPALLEAISEVIISISS